MGMFLNTGLNRFKQVVDNSYFYVDKTGLIAHLNQWLFSVDRFVCVSRARRFGKSIAADMIAAYYDKTVDSRSLFEPFEIAKHPSFEKGLNKFNVLYWDAQQFMDCSKPEDFLPKTNRCLISEMRAKWEIPDDYAQSIPDALCYVYAQYGEQFVIIIDEWDGIFRHQFPDRIQRAYVDFLRQLFKSRALNDCIALAYVTGIFPIVKYNTESSMNMFREFTMVDSHKLAPYVGFTKDEVKALCERYQMDFNECSRWYDGYKLKNIEHIYNPNAIYQCMQNEEFRSYWTKTGTYEQISDHITMNFDGLKDDVARLMTGDCVPVKTLHFKNKMTDLNSKNDVLTLLIHLGYLGYDETSGECFIPNEEIRMEYEVALEDCGMEGFVQAYARSKHIMDALRSREASTVAAEIQKVHDDISSVLTYNRENDLALVVMYACASARKEYIFVRELPSGAGFADIVMIPIKSGRAAIVVELKWDQNAEGAIAQIKSRRYANLFGDYKGEVLLCGVNYDKDKKLHDCVIETWNA